MQYDEMKYFVYVRKSSEGKERQALSHEGQLTEIAKIIAREGLKVVDTYIESKSAHVPDNRPMFNEMLKRIRNGEANGIVAWHTNRLSRNPKEAGVIQQMLQDGKIKSIIVPYRHFQSDDNALLFSIESSEANQYSRDLKVVVKRGLYLKCGMGQPPIIAPPGYMNTKRVERASNEILPDPERWHVMRKAFDLMLTGQYSINKIAAILNEEYNFRTRSSRMREGRPIAISVLHRAFTNQFYTGYFTYKGKTYPGKYKPMITVEEFDLIQEILGRKDARKQQKHEFSFTGFIKCGSCGCAITGSRKLKKLITSGEYRSYAFYHCTKRKGKAACSEKEYTKEEDIERIILNELERISIDSRFRPWVFETAMQGYAEERDNQMRILEKTREYEQTLKRELDTLLDLRISNEISDVQYQEKKAEREALIIRVREKHERLERNIDGWVEQLNNVLEMSVGVLEAFKNGNTLAKKSICQMIGWNWTLKEKKLGFTRHEWLQDLQELKSHFDAEKDRLELVNSFTEYSQTASFDYIFPIVSSLRDNCRTLSDNLPSP